MHVPSAKHLGSSSIQLQICCCSLKCHKPPTLIQIVIITKQWTHNAPKQTDKQKIGMIFVVPCCDQISGNDCGITLTGRTFFWLFIHWRVVRSAICNSNNDRAYIIIPNHLPSTEYQEIQQSKQKEKVLHYSFGPSDAIWRGRSWSTMVQVMACCLTAPSHYLNQCWLIIGTVLWHSSEDIFIRRCEDTNQLNKIENCIFKITLRSPRGQWVQGWFHNYFRGWTIYMSRFHNYFCYRGYSNCMLWQRLVVVPVFAIHWYFGS